MGEDFFFPADFRGTREYLFSPVIILCVQLVDIETVSLPVIDYDNFVIDMQRNTVVGRKFLRQGFCSIALDLREVSLGVDDPV